MRERTCSRLGQWCTKWPRERFRLTARVQARFCSAILRDEPLSLSRLNPHAPPGLEIIIRKALEKDRELRYQSAAEMRSDLKRLQRDTEPGRSSAISIASTGQSISPERLQSEVIVPKTAVRRKSTWIAIGAAVLLLAGAVAWRLKTQQTSSPQPAMTQSQLTTNSAGHGVKGAAISPDGKYLAYSDDTGLHIKLVETGEMRTVPLPAEAASGHGAWFPAAWFPDGTHLLADLDIAGKPPSVWILSLVGEAPRRFRDNAWGQSISPDGSTVVFTAERSAVGDHEIWLVGASGENPRKLSTGDEGTGFAQVAW